MASETSAGLSASELEAQLQERDNLRSTIARLGEAKQRTEREHARRRLVWLQQPLLGAAPATAASDVAAAAQQAATDIAAAVASLQQTHAHTKVIDLAATGTAPDAPDHRLAQLQSEQLKLVQLRRRRQTAQEQGAACIADAAQGVDPRALKAFRRHGASADARGALGTPVGRISVPLAGGGRSVRRAALLTAKQMGSLHSRVLRPTPAA